MKNLLTNLKVQSLVLFIFILQTFSASAQQTLTQVNGWNAYVHLPASYSSSSQSYPTIIFFPGIGEIGTNASKVISQGPGAYIAQGWNGNVQVDGNTVEFIVISLQSPMAYPNEYTMNVQIQKLKSLYRIDNNKLYLTGLSHGGWCSSTFVTGDPMGGPFTYASQIAAVVTVEGVIPDDNSPYPNLFDNYASVGGKLLSFEQRLDGRGGQNVVNRMNNYKANSAFFIETNFGNAGHCCWSEFYGGGGTQPGVFNIGGVNQNLYQWLARQRLGGSTTPPTPPAANQPPTANAGADKTITLPTNTVSLAGSGTDADGTISSYSWTKVSGPAGGNISSATSATTNITALQQGVYNFRLTVKDNNGASATDDVTVTVNAAANQAPKANAGTDKTITLPTSTVSLTGSGTDADGTISSYNWTKVSGPAGGNISSATSATTNITALQQGVYNFRLTVKDNSGAYATDDVTVTVNAAANQAPKANAGTDKTITLPTNTVSLAGSGTDADGTISSYNWTKVSGPAGGNISSANSATTNITALQQGVYNFRITVKDNNGASATDDVTVTVNTAAGTSGGGSAGNGEGCNSAAPVKHFLAYTSAPGEIYRPNGSAWKGGDTIVITGSNYSVIEFNNIQGDECRPIVIMPQNKTTTPVFRITNNCKYLKIWGGKNPYGFIIANGAFAINMSSNIEVDNVEISGGSVGVYCKQDPRYDDPSTWAKSGYVMRDFKFTNLFIHDVQGEGFYVGSTSPNGYSVRKPNGQDTLILPIRLENVEVSNCIIQRTGWDGIQISNARGGNKVFNNTIWDYGKTKTYGQEAGVIIGGNTIADVYNNKITKGTGSGVQIFGYGVNKIYNNYFDSTGVDGSSLGLQTIYANDYITTPEQNEKQTVEVYGNFIKNPMTKGAIFITNYQTNSNPSQVYDNKFCISNPPANWASIYLKLLVSGTYNNNNILSCDSSSTVTTPAPPPPPTPPAANQAPVVKVENDKSITLPVNTTGLNVIQATDADGAIVSYLWTKLSGPAAGNIVAATQRQTTVQNLVQGVYKYVITVTDNEAAKASDTLQITVNAEVVVPTSGKSLMVNIYGGSNGIPGTQWNNWNLSSSNASGNLKYEDGAGSNIKATITGDRRVVDNGLNYATSSTAVDPRVLRYNCAATSYRTLTITGLTSGAVYDFDFFASRASTGNSTIFQLQDQRYTIKTDNNINAVAKFTNITADASGKMEIIISSLNVWNYIAGFIIYEKEAGSPLKSGSVVNDNSISYGEDILEATNSKVTVFPNPFVNEFKVQVDDKENGNYAIILTDISGKRSFYKEVKKASNLLLVNVPVANLPSGVYILQILNTQTGKQTVHKVIKN